MKAFLNALIVLGKRWCCPGDLPLALFCYFAPREPLPGGCPGQENDIYTVTLFYYPPRVVALAFQPPFITLVPAATLVCCSLLSLQECRACFLAWSPPRGRGTTWL